MHPRTILGLADSGAHVGGIQDSANSTFLLTYWVRDRARPTGRDGIPIEQAVKMHTMDPAHVCGMLDRGQLKAGLKADLNLRSADCAQMVENIVVQNCCTIVLYLSKYKRLILPRRKQSRKPPRAI